ncbi:MAG: nitrogen fixation protein NifU [Gaiellaceae bacterium]|jgi:nitrogen fixation NifU-like protein|nr:nitrogen fixation protein NifU [Gaiellaceae bacterium]
MDDLYREHILDHYKNPRNHGTIEDADVTAEGVNPLCGDQLAIDLKIVDGRIADIKFHGRGCSISQAATSMLTELAEGLDVDEAAALSKDDLLAELGIPLSPVRLKCALLGLGTLRIALNRHSGTTLPDGWAGMDEVDWR